MVIDSEGALIVGVMRKKQRKTTNEDELVMIIDRGGALIVGVMRKEKRKTTIRVNDDY